LIDTIISIERGITRLPALPRIPNKPLYRYRGLPGECGPKQSLLDSGPYRTAALLMHLDEPTLVRAIRYRKGYSAVTSDKVCNRMGV
jgi:hypothetical protein